MDWVEVFNITLDAGTCTGIGTTTMRKPNLRFQDIDLKVDPQLNVIKSSKNLDEFTCCQAMHVVMVSRS